MTSTTRPDTDLTTPAPPSQRNGAVPPVSAPPASDTHGGHGARGVLGAAAAVGAAGAVSGIANGAPIAAAQAAAQPALSPFAGPTPAPGGPAPVISPPGLGAAGVVGPAAPVVAGAAVGVAAAGVAAASSATVTAATATLGSAATTLLPQVPTTAPAPTGRKARAPGPPSKPQRAPRTRPAKRGAGLRKAHLKLTRIDPWTVMKISFMLAIAFGIMTVVSVFVIWSMLDTAGVFTAISDSVNSVTGDSGDSGVNIMEWVALDRVLGFATLLAVVDVVLITALSTLFAFLYNLASTLLGGFEVTLVEDQR